MAQVAFAHPHFTTHHDNMDPFNHIPRLTSAPRIAMVPNPDFTFPRASPSNEDNKEEPMPAASRPLPPSRSASDASRSVGAEHRRAATSLQLPSFSFNPANTSGLQADVTPLATPSGGDVAPATPRHHKRTTSEFVGGDSRLIRASPYASPITTFTNANPMQMSNRPNHRHRRSGAVSSHDVSNIMIPSNPLSHLSSHTQGSAIGQVKSGAENKENPYDPVTCVDAAERPVSRRQVEFSDEIEYIPRPLSTVSSETASFDDIPRGHSHSASDSISSILHSKTLIPESCEAASALDAASEQMTGHEYLDGSREQIASEEVPEGIWLARAHLTDTNTLQCMHSASSSDETSAEEDTPSGSKAKNSNLHVTDLSDTPMLSVVDSADSDQASCPYQGFSHAGSTHHRSFTHNMKGWVLQGRESMMNPVDPQSDNVLSAVGSAVSALPASTPAPDPLAKSELDLEAVLGVDASPPESSTSFNGYFTRFEPNKFFAPRSSSAGNDVVGDDGIVDLDAALGSYIVPEPVASTHRQRRSLYSSQKHPAPFHHRAHTEPALATFRMTTPPQGEMENVIEEDAEDDEVESTHPPATGFSSHHEEAGIGIQIVDEETPRMTNAFSPDVSWIPARPSTGYGNYGTRLSSMSLDRRASSIIDETIPEEASPVEPSSLTSIDAINADKEGRAPSATLTKSSDESDTPTIDVMSSGLNTVTVDVDSGHLSDLNTPQASALSSPDLSRGQSSFETSRLGTSGSSATGNRTMSSATTLEHGSDIGKSVEERPSLISTATTMSHAPVLPTRRPLLRSSLRTDSPDEFRNKRQSTHSLSNLNLFGSRSHAAAGDASRPQTANAFQASAASAAPKKEHRLRKLMFWGRKKRQDSSPSQGQ